MEDNRLSQRDSEEHESEKEHVDHEQDLPDQNSAHEQDDAGDDDQENHNEGETPRDSDAEHQENEVDNQDDQDGNNESEAENEPEQDHPNDESGLEREHDEAAEEGEMGDKEEHLESNDQMNDEHEADHDGQEEGHPNEGEGEDQQEESQADVDQNNEEFQEKESTNVSPQKSMKHESEKQLTTRSSKAENTDSAKKVAAFEENDEAMKQTEQHSNLASSRANSKVEKDDHSQRASCEHDSDDIHHQDKLESSTKDAMKAEKDQTKEERQTSHINNEKYNEYAEYEIRDNENLPARRKLESALLNYENHSGAESGGTDDEHPEHKNQPGTESNQKEVIMIADEENEGVHQPQPAEEDEIQKKIEAAKEKKKKKFLLDASEDAQSSIANANKGKVKTTSRTSEQGHRQDPEEIRRKHKLQEVLRMKKELEEKIKGLDDQIKDLNKSLEPEERTSPKNKKIVRSKQEEEIMKQKAQDLVRKMKAERIRKEQQEEDRKQKFDKIIGQEIAVYNKERKPRDAGEKHIDHRELSREDRALAVVSSQSSKKVPLYKQLEQASEEQRMQELERRKKILAERRELYKPLKENATIEADHMHEIERKHHDSEKKREISDDSRTKFITKKYTSKFLTLVQEQEKEKRALEEMREQEKRILAEKKQQYGKIVKDMYLPKINRSKQATLQEHVKDVIDKAQAIESYDNHWRIKNKRSFNIKRSAKVDYGLEGQTSEGENHYPERSSHVQTASGAETITRDGVSRGNRERSNEVFLPRSQGNPVQRRKPEVFRITGNAEKKAKRQKSPEETEEPEKQTEDVADGQNKKQYPNYIEELKRKREEYEKKGLKYKKKPWERHLKDEKLSYAEKVAYVLDDVKTVEQVAKEKEMWLRENAKVGSKDAKVDQDEIDDMYIESIKAKIQVLSELKNQ